MLVILDNLIVTKIIIRMNMNLIIITNNNIVTCF